MSHARRRLPWELTPAQEKLKQQIIAAAEPFRRLFERMDVYDPRRDEQYALGKLVQPAHVEDGWVPVPERWYTVDYAPGYGAICQSLCTSNGSPHMIASCVRDDTIWVPATYSPVRDGREELEG
jgi:hypothetical protein